MIQSNKSTEAILQNVEESIVWCCDPSIKIGYYPPKWILQFIINNNPQ